MRKKLMTMVENDYMWGNAHDIGDVPLVLVDRFSTIF
jgi:hypothetical protein